VTAVTTPLDETVATAVFADTHVAALVTSFVVLSLYVIVQVNCEVEPMAGTEPVIAMLVIVVADAGVELLHADKDRPATATGKNRTSERTQLPIMTAPERGVGAGYRGRSHAQTPEMCQDDCKSVTLASSPVPLQRAGAGARWVHEECARSCAARPIPRT
jgi:hypothetical protein